MKNKIILSAIAIAFISIVCSSCNKIAQQLAQRIGWTGIDVTINVPVVNDTLSHSNIGTGTFTYNLDSLIKAETGNKFGIKNIDSFRFSSCTLNINPNGDPELSFANFESAEAIFFTNGNTTSTILGEIDNNPDAYATTLNVPINTTTDLMPYIPSSGPITITYTLDGKLRRAITTACTVTAHIEYNIHVKP
jgi:hypothetical protein